MSPSTVRILFVLAFLAACVAFRLGYRRFRRVPPSATTWGALRLGFFLSLALLAGCANAGGGGAVTGGASRPSPEGGAGGTSPASPGRVDGHARTGLGQEADEVWADLMILWRNIDSFAGEEPREKLQRAYDRTDALLARFGGLQRVTDEAPGLVALLRTEFTGRLGSVHPAAADCYSPPEPRAEGGHEYDNLAMRIDAVEELAGKGYINDWIRTVVLGRMREDLATLRAAMAGGDAWRSEDPSLSQLDMAAIEDLARRVEAALAALEAP
jgi:hypothetical protein